MRNKISSFIVEFLLSFSLLVSHSAYSQSIDDIYFVTENYPPFNFEENGKLQGISVELLVLMLNKLQASQTIDNFHLQPWARGYNRLLTTEGTCLFSTTRTKERENLFKWVGPIFRTSVSIVARKNKHIKIDSADDINHYKIGAVRDDVGEQLLLAAGVTAKNMDVIGGVDAISRSFEKLNRNRIDAFAYDSAVAFWAIKRFGYLPDDYEIVYTFEKASIYYAFHKDTSNSIINDLQNALDALKTGGEYQNIIYKYHQ